MSYGTLTAKIGSMVAEVNWEMAEKPFGLFTALCQPCFEQVVGLDEVSPNTNYSTL